MSSLVTVTVRQGALRGRRCSTPAGTAYYSFQGVPYARPPLASLRFKAPQPPEPWTGIRDATKDGPPCPHFDMEESHRMVEGSEDCLFLNVYTPRLPAGRGEAARAVLVWIHGGGFHVGSGERSRYGPDHLMERDVVLVTFNYRLGPLGFLSLGTTDAPGNAGLKDQVMALRWVKDNIAAFGGDPDNVTIFGESAGGAAVHMHTLSPMSKGLFRRAIVQSGCALNAWAVARDPVGRGRRLAAAAGMANALDADTASVAAFLRAATPEQLVLAVEGARSADERRLGVNFTFVPCVEAAGAALPGAPAFLPDEPAALLAAGPERVPIVFGFTSDEGLLLIRDEAGSEEKLQALAADLERKLPVALLRGRKDMQLARQLVAKLKDFYFGGGELTLATLKGLVDLNTDLLFVRDLLKAAAAHARLGAPVFVYEFAFSGRLNLGSLLFGDPRLKGVCHADELAYLFSVSKLPAKAEEGSPEMRVIHTMTKLWANFAKTGNPTAVLDETVTESWPQYSESSPKFLRISDQLSVGNGILKERMDFWNELFKANL